MDLKELHQKYGQSVWLDYIRRHLLQSGEFARLVQEDGIRGATSNPSIFDKAIAGSTDYGPALERYETRKDATASAIYERLAIEDIQQAADILRPVYDEADRRDGYVSMEVSPYLAHDTRATIDEATPGRLRGALLGSLRSGLTQVSTRPGQDQAICAEEERLGGVVGAARTRLLTIANSGPERRRK